MAENRELSNEDYQKIKNILPWDTFHSWLQCICVVTFDLELGQALELYYPPHARLTEKEKTSICYLSFPDSNSGCMGDVQFHFRFRQCPSPHSLVPALITYNKTCSPALQTDSGYYYGYVHFRQTKDSTTRRGYFQKSVVLISKLPLVVLFTQLVEIIALEYFDTGDASIEAACHNIDQWPLPQPGQSLSLPIMGTVIQVQIPKHTDHKLPVAPNAHNRQTLSPNIILSSVYEVDLFSIFLPVLPHIYLLWELVLTAEPLVVMAPSPTLCTSAVQALINMIWPLKYVGDYRPYFTIHDNEFKEYTTRTQSPPNVILGVTNPFFVKTLQHWPHVVRIGDMSSSAPAKIFGKLKKSGNLKTLDFKPGVYTRYKPFLTKDKTILKRLISGIQAKRPAEVQSLVLQRHLQELTQSFLFPLEQYLCNLMPLQKDILPHCAAPQLKAFDVDKFLETLERCSPEVTSGVKGDWLGLYRKFFQSINFQGWWSYRCSEVQLRLEAVHTETLSDQDLLAWTSGRAEVEVVDLILRLREKLQSVEKKSLQLNSDVVQKLRYQHDIIISSLPQDLQSVLKSS